MLKKLIRKYLVARVEVEYVKTVIKEGTPNDELVDETSEVFDAMTEAAYPWVIDIFKTVGYFLLICIALVGIGVFVCM